MRRQFNGITLDARRCLIAAFCAVYLLLLSSPAVIVRAQDNITTDPETTASQPPVEAPIPEPVTPEPAPTPSPETPSVPNQPTQPAPEETEQKYIYNPETGKWENDKYSWDPVTKQTAPKTLPTYSYNPETNHWDTTAWVYSPEQAKYVAQTTESPSSSNNDSTNTQTNPSDILLNSDTSTQKLNIAQEPEQKKLTVDSTNSGDYFDLYLNLNISTTHSSNAVSGDASVLQNTTGGNAVTGNALAMANIINMVQSVWGWQGVTPELYTANIQGDYFGDILINPASLGLANNNCGCGNLTVNGSVSNSIENNVDLEAKSGNASVSGNTTGGDAITGNATAIANIINMINTSMTAGQSFVGTLNINGNLEGDVLMPDNLVDQLIASNIPSTSIDLGNTDISLEDTTSIENNINTSAKSGSASVNDNTKAGNANTGNADTNVTVFNLTNRNIIGTNALLVFVNVAGNWVGFITDAPTGATSAILGGGITTNSCNYCQSDSGIETDVNTKIVNNINALAESGDAEVSHNTNGGDATTGDAKALANVSNITSSNVSMSGWFGILFINVLNNWLGSFGTNTAYGNTPVTPSTPDPRMTESSSSGVNPAYYPDSPKPASQPKETRVKAYQVAIDEDDKGRIVLASTIETGPPPSGQSTTSSIVGSTSDSNNNTAIALLALTSILILTGLTYGDKFRILRRNFTSS